MKRILPIFGFVFLALCAFTPRACADTAAMDKARTVHAAELAAMQVVETGGEKDPAHATSNNGRDNGWYQICRAYYEDAKDSPLGRRTTWPTYERAVASREWSERAVVAYWSRYATMKPGAAADEARARIHNGGPSGAHKSDTAAYWRKVEKAMREAHK